MAIIVLLSTELNVVVEVSEEVSTPASNVIGTPLTLTSPDAPAVKSILLVVVADDPSVLVIS